MVATDFAAVDSDGSEIRGWTVAALTAPSSADYFAETVDVEEIAAATAAAAVAAMSEPIIAVLEAPLSLIAVASAVGKASKTDSAAAVEQAMKIAAAAAARPR